MEPSCTLVWLRQDLRIRDNPALYHAAKLGRVIVVYIHDEAMPESFQLGEASRWWLYHSLLSLNQTLENKLNVFSGTAMDIMAMLVEKYTISGIYWNRCYEPWRVQQDAKLKQYFKEQGLEVKSFNGSLLWEPWDIAKKDHTPYKVFTPFYKKGCLMAAAPRKPLVKPRGLNAIKLKHSESVKNLALLPQKNWYQKFNDHWQVGEEHAFKRLHTFLGHTVQHYKKGRDFPALASTSRLSPHLHFGEISPHSIWHKLLSHGVDENREHFRSELAWREFSYHLLYHFPTLPDENFQAKFDAFPWTENPVELALWQKGQTGIPLVDAGMRELWQTGYMHNRVRMVVASFLVKNLLIHWHHGRDWFWDCLVDADLANNSASWQWVAGSGADAAPYFRIFNPVTQGEKFDPKGEYVKQYVPELKNMPDKYIHKPWEAPASVLMQAGVRLGKAYPKPIIDLKSSRQKALEAYQWMKDH